MPKIKASKMKILKANASGMKTSKAKASKIKEVLLAIAITIIFALFVGYGIATFYKTPMYEDFCNNSNSRFNAPYAWPEKAGGVNCTYVQPSKEITNECTQKKGDVYPTYNRNRFIDSYYCEMCNRQFQDSSERYNRNVFIITLIIGLAAIIIGGVVLNLASVSSGIMSGGVITVVYGTIRYWGNMPDIIRFIELGIVLAVLIWIGYKKLSK